MRSEIGARDDASREAARLLNVKPGAQASDDVKAAAGYLAAKLAV